MDGEVHAATNASYVAELVVDVLVVAPPVVQFSFQLTVMACVGLVLHVVVDVVVPPEVLVVVVLPLTWHCTSLASVFSTVAFSVVFAIFSTARCAPCSSASLRL